MSPDLQPIIHKAEVLLLELSQLNRNGPVIVIVHKYRISVEGAECQAGEEVSHVLLAQRGSYITVQLPLAPRLVFDYLARNKHIPQSATQIAAGIRISNFYRYHGINSGELSIRKISRSAIKEYVKRIRNALAITFQKASLPLDPMRVLMSDSTGGIGVRYHLRAAVEWLHCNDIAERYSRVRGRY